MRQLVRNELLDGLLTTDGEMLLKEAYIGASLCLEYRGDYSVVVGGPCLSWVVSG